MTDRTCTKRNQKYSQESFTERKEQYSKFRQCSKNIVKDIVEEKPSKTNKKLKTRRGKKDRRYKLNTKTE